MDNRVCLLSGIHALKSTGGAAGISPVADREARRAEPEPWVEIRVTKGSEPWKSGTFQLTNVDCGLPCQVSFLHDPPKAAARLRSQS